MRVEGVGRQECAAGSVVDSGVIGAGAEDSCGVVGGGGMLEILGVQFSQGYPATARSR